MGTGRVYGDALEQHKQKDGNQEEITRIQLIFCFLQYTASVKNSTLDTTARAMAALASVYDKDPKLATIMGAPTLSVEDKQSIIAELAKHTGGADKGDTVKNFLKTLADYNRLSLLQSICGKFNELMSASKGELELTIVSATVSYSGSEGVDM